MMRSNSRAEGRSPRAAAGAAPAPPLRHGSIADWRTAVALAVGLVLAVIAVFGRTVGFGFVGHDDPIYVTGNPWVLGGLHPAGVAWAFTTSRGSVWVPLTWLSLMLDAELYGSWAGGYHLTNVLLHAASAAGLFLLLWRATSRTWPAAVAAAIFALHPQRVEAVAWVTARKDVLSGFCLMLTLWAYGWYVRRPSPGRYAVVAGAFTLGLMAKSMLVTTPVLLLLLDAWPLGRSRRPRDLVRLGLEKLPLAAISVVVAVATVAVQGDALVAEPHMTPPRRLGRALLVSVGYLGMFLHPENLAAAYPRWDQRFAWTAVAAAAALASGITLAAWLERRRRPYLIVGWLWYLVALLPVIGLLQIGAVTMADRFTYLPLIGPVVALVWLAADVVDAAERADSRTGDGAAPGGTARQAALGRALAAVAATVVLVVLAVGSFRQAAIWSDTETLWRRTLERTSGNGFAHTNLAGELLKQRRLDDAGFHVARALEIDPSNGFAAGQAAALALAAGRADEAMAICQALIRADPRDFRAHTLVGLLLARQERFREAVDHYRVALAVRPEWVDAICGITEALLGCGEPQQAVEMMLVGRRLWPEHPAVARQFGRVLLATGNGREAAEQLRRAVDHDPADAATWNALGLALGQSGRIDEAIEGLRRGVELEPGVSGFHRDLGFALRQRRSFAAAAASYRRAVDLDPRNRMATNDLAWLLATCPDPAVRSGAEAVALAVEASRLAGDAEPTVLDTLSAAHAEAGDFAVATAVARRALDLAEQRGDAALAADVRAHLARFAERSPVRDPPEDAPETGVDARPRSGPR